jgi:Asp-tRNA(Asn)/Glu-tRNA(Gln) amidotransferase A subunit family amidase
MNVIDVSLPSIAQKLASGEVPLVDYIESCMAAIANHEESVQALLPEVNRRARLLQEARVLQERFPSSASRPPLYGVLVGVKDLFHADGFITRAGSALPFELFAGAEAEVVSRLKRAGALVLGKTVTTEFAFMEPGPTRNPHNLDHTPGGSSSGSAAAMACGFCSLALGTQTIGSISRPAAYCGVVGFKPSFGRVSRAGVVPFSESADHIGYFTHSVAGARLVAPVLCDDWNQALSSTEDARNIVCGIPDGAFLEQAEPAALRHFEEVVQRLQSFGCEIRRVPLFADIADINARHRAMITAELAEFHKPWFSDCESSYRKGTRDAIKSGFAVSAAELQRGKDGRFALRSEIHRAMNSFGIDLWLSPSATGEAPKGIAATGSPNMNLPWTHAGLPTVSIPSGKSACGLPFGLQLAARFYADEKLLIWAEEICGFLLR